MLSGSGRVSGSGSGYFVSGSGSGHLVPGSGSGHLVSGSGSGYLVPGSGSGCEARHYDLHVLPGRVSDC